jgi:hypothetical protein
MERTLHLWRWLYTDQFGKRRLFPCLLSEENGRQLKDAERVEGSLEAAAGPARAHERFSAARVAGDGVPR